MHVKSPKGSPVVLPLTIRRSTDLHNSNKSRPRWSVTLSREFLLDGGVGMLISNLISDLSGDIVSSNFPVLAFKSPSMITSPFS